MIIVMTGSIFTMVLVMTAQPFTIKVVDPQFRQQFFQVLTSSLFDFVRMNLFPAVDLKLKWITVCKREQNDKCAHFL